AEDIRHYGSWLRERALKQIGSSFPDYEVTAETIKQRPDLKALVGKKLTVTAWLWARTVKSPNPAFRHVDVPLASTFVLSTKGEGTYVEPGVEDDHYRFIVKAAKPPKEANNGTKIARGANFKCLLSETAIESDYIKAEAQAGRMGARLM